MSTPRRQAHGFREDRRRLGNAQRDGEDRGRQQGPADRGHNHSGSADLRGSLRGGRRAFGEAARGGIGEASQRGGREKSAEEEGGRSGVESLSAGNWEIRRSSQTRNVSLHQTVFNRFSAITMYNYNFLRNTLKSRYFLAKFALS